MITGHLAHLAATYAPAIANHLWQSTLFAVAVALLTLTLRKSQARVRYGIWLLASLKFLVPFALLVSLGGHLASPHAAVKTPAVLYSVVEEVGQPFPPANAPAIAPAGNLNTLLPDALAITWFCGMAAVIAQWCWRWRRVYRAMRGAACAEDGREVATLRRLERAAGIRPPIAFLIAHGALEPGIFGLVRPVLLWPTAFSAHLDDAQLEAILAHEICHVRRRDNLAAAIHMLVEAVFWFHPLVWWIGARLVDERERACDEAVVQLGAEPQVYAESILKASRFCVESPLVCVSGVTGSNLEKRIVRIMTQQLAGKLTLARKLMLAALGLPTVIAPVAFGLLHTPTASAQAPPQALPALESVSIKPNQGGPTQMLGLPPLIGPGKLVLQNQRVVDLIAYAYVARDFQITGGPTWVRDQRYDIDAEEPASRIAELEKLTPRAQGEERRLMAKAILAERFHLQVTRATKDMPGYVLVIAEGGPKLSEAAAQPVAPNGEKMISVREMSKGGKWDLTLTGPVGALAGMLSEHLQQPVVDKTGLTLNYDLTLETGPTGTNDLPLASNAEDKQKEDITTALVDQLGLKLEPQHAPVEMIQIDQVEAPAED
jgi:uncharacterized protein (TIGR03435 family)